MKHSPCKSKSPSQSSGMVPCLVWKISQMAFGVLKFRIIVYLVETEFENIMFCHIYDVSKYYSKFINVLVNHSFSRFCSRSLPKSWVCVQVHCVILSFCVPLRSLFQIWWMYVHFTNTLKSIDNTFPLIVF